MVGSDVGGIVAELSPGCYPNNNVVLLQHLGVFPKHAVTFRSRPELCRLPQVRRPEDVQVPEVEPPICFHQDCESLQKFATKWKRAGSGIRRQKFVFQNSTGPSHQRDGLPLLPTSLIVLLEVVPFCRNHLNSQRT